MLTKWEVPYKKHVHDSLAVGCCGWGCFFPWYCSIKPNTLVWNPFHWACLPCFSSNSTLPLVQLQPYAPFFKTRVQNSASSTFLIANIFSNVQFNSKYLLSCAQYEIKFFLCFPKTECQERNIHVSLWSHVQTTDV